MPLEQTATTPAVRVSVVIPLYNGSDFIEQTLGSVVFQEGGVPTEVVVVDDGSTDDGAQKARAVLAAAGLPHIVQRQPNAGASAARTTGLGLSTAPFVQFLDADDLLRPRALAAKLAALDATDGDVAHAGWQRWEAVRGLGFVAGRISDGRMDAPDGDIELATFASFWAPPAALLYRRTAVDRIGGWHPALPVIQDARMIQDAAHADLRFVHVPETLADYRDHLAGSLSKRSQTAFVQDVFANTQEIEARWAAAGTLTPKRQEALADSYRHCAEAFFWSSPHLFLQACARIRKHGHSLPVPLNRWRLLTERLGWTTARAIALPHYLVRRSMKASRDALRPVKRRLQLGRSPATL